MMCAVGRERRIRPGGRDDRGPNDKTKARCVMTNVLIWTAVGIVGFLIVCGLVGCCCHCRRRKGCAT